MELLARVRSDFLLGMGRISAFWGFNKAMGQIYGLLYLSPQPMSLDAIAGELGMSKANVSLNGRALERWGLIRRLNQRNDRRDYYVAEVDFWKVVRDILRERDKKEFDQALNTVSSCLRSVRQEKEQHKDDEARFVEERLKNMQQFFNSLDTMARAVLALDEFHLPGLGKLGLDKRRRPGGDESAGVQLSRETSPSLPRGDN